MTQVKVRYYDIRQLLDHSNTRLVYVKLKSVFRVSYSTMVSTVLYRFLYFRLFVSVLENFVLCLRCVSLSLQKLDKIVKIQDVYKKRVEVVRFLHYQSCENLNDNLFGDVEINTIVFTQLQILQYKKITSLLHTGSVSCFNTFTFQHRILFKSHCTLL